MSRKKNYYGIIDTETTGGLDNPLVYDLALTISDKVGNVTFSKMWLIEEILTNKKKMKSAYYAEKLPLYRSMYKKDKNLLVPFKVAKQELNHALETYKVTFVSAYNLAFDLRALKYTNYKLDYESAGGWDMCKFIAKKYQYVDIWSAACETLYQQRGYSKMADLYNWVTEYGNIKTNAECGYAYISKNYGYKEEHTALADTLIEKEILIRCLRTKQKYTKNRLVGSPWRLVQKKKE